MAITNLQEAVMRGWRRALVSVYLMAGLFTGCKAQPIDKSLLTGDPCAPPCWHNIVPGISDEADVRSQLESSPLVRKGTLDYSLTEEAGEQLVKFHWQSPRGKRPNVIVLRDGKVLWIEIGLDYELTLGEIVNKYGSPESIYAYAGCADFCWYSINFDYPTMGLMLQSYSLADPGDVADGTVLISEEVKITTACYFAPASLQKILGEVLMLPPDRVEYFMTSRQKWEGFGRYRLAGW